MKNVLVPLICMIAIGPQAVYAEIIFAENYDDLDDNGLSTTTGPVIQNSGGVLNTPYLEGTRSNFTPIFTPLGPAASNLLHGNLENMYGEVITVSYYGQVFSSGATNVPFRNSFLHDGGTTRWHNFFSDSTTLVNANDWVPNQLHDQHQLE